MPKKSAADARLNPGMGGVAGRARPVTPWPASTAALIALLVLIVIGTAAPAGSAASSDSASAAPADTLHPVAPAPAAAARDSLPPMTPIPAAVPAAPMPRSSGGEVINNRILSVNVSGVEVVDTLLVLSTFQLKPGDIYRLDAIRDGIRALYQLDLFDQVEVVGDRTAQGVNLTVRVVESPRISALEITGNKEVDTDKLKEKLSGTVGKVANRRISADVTDKVLGVYRDEGFPLAEVRADFVAAEKSSERILTVDIDEGARVQVMSITFTGNTAFTDKTLRGEMDTKQKSFWRKGHLKPDKLGEDLDKVRTYYQRHGYRDVRIVDHKVNYSGDGRTADIAIQIEEGPVYTMGTVGFEGNAIFPTSTLQGLMKFRPGDRYNRQKIDESAGEIGGAYADRGYLYAQVDPEEKLDSTTVYVTYKIEEQEVSKVRLILITGNTRTKEKVIRRQLYLYPGQKFDRALLIRSQRELFQLGFFQDVQVDFHPLPNSYDVDLVLKVEEKAVGTASAGAGFSSQGGLTGFIELGHPNIFGNGQAINLRLEKGSKTANYELSFTEPWLLDSPTSLGIDLYRNNLIRDIYEVNRTGGGLRLSRPFPGLAYTRVFGNYAFEHTGGLSRVTINEKPDSTFSADSTLATITQTISTPDPVQFDPSKRNTSSITFGLTRNSTDHPLYPHAGTLTTLTAEMAGGLLQGDVHYQKYTLENRVYLKLNDFLKVTKPALMLRTQIGGIGFNGERDPLRVPFPGDTIPAGMSPEDRLFKTEAFELFRLGGTSTVQALRGYSDYEVVPAENVRRRVVITRHTTYTGGIPSATADTTVVYDTFPGGKYYGIVTLERQFVIAEPLHAVLFAEAGGTWNRLRDVSFSSLHKSLGIGVRMEIPLLGQVGFDYAYGFDRLNKDPDPAIGGRYDRRGWQPHLLFGRIF